MSMLHATLVSADQPSLEERGGAVDAWHDFVRRVGAAAEDQYLMLVTGRRQSGMSPPAVGVNHRPALYSALDEGKQVSVETYAICWSPTTSPETTSATA